MTNIMRCLYNFGFYLMLPFIFIRLLYKARRNPAYKARWRERLALFSTPALQKSIWIHAVSLGEAVAATPLIKAVKKRYPNTPVVVTTMTPTGSAHIQKTFGNNVYHTYIPYDYSGAVKRFLAHINPKLLIIMETELWPNVVHYCSKNNVYVVIANARLSQRSTTSYKKITWFMRPILANINIIAAQSQLDKERFISIGAQPNKVQVVGNIKFDITIPADIPQKAQQLRHKWGENRQIWIAASTHNNEEQQILAAFKTIKSIIPNALLILVPRHPERFAAVTNLCKHAGFKVISHKQQTPCTLNTDIIIGDTMGELLLLYAASDVAFVGGSLVPTGGHNLLEPAAVNVPVITGPHVNNFLAIAQLLTTANALITVNNANELTQQVIKLLQDKNLRQKYAQAGLEVVMRNKGTLKKLLDLLTPLNPPFC